MDGCGDRGSCTVMTAEAPTSVAMSLQGHFKPITYLYYLILLYIVYYSLHLAIACYGYDT